MTDTQMTAPMAAPRGTPAMSPEIAISILAELTAVRYGYRVPEPVPILPQAVVEAGCTT